MLSQSEHTLHYYTATISLNSTLMTAWINRLFRFTWKCDLLTADVTRVFHSPVVMFSGPSETWQMRWCWWYCWLIMECSVCCRMHWIRWFDPLALLVGWLPYFSFFTDSLVFVSFEHLQFSPAAVCFELKFLVYSCYFCLINMCVCLFFFLYKYLARKMGHYLNHFAVKWC